LKVQDPSGTETFLHKFKKICSIIGTDVHRMHEYVASCVLLYCLVIMYYKSGANLTYSTENQVFDVLNNELCVTSINSLSCHQTS